MLPYARLVPGPGFQPVRAALYYGQRFVVVPRLRRVVARCLGKAIAWRHGAAACRSSSPAEEAGLQTAVATLHHRGLAPLQPLLSPKAVEEMMTWLKSRPVVGPDGSAVPLADLPPGTTNAAYSLSTILACPHILDIINNPQIVEIARRYIGCRPTVSGLGLRWSLPRPARATDVQAFHRDPDDWRFVKLFIYLTDVDQKSGPHVYVAGSHRTRAPFLSHLYKPEELARRYGAGALTPVTGPAGTSFIADTYGIHAGLVPEDRPRLLLQVQYSVLPVFAFRYAPEPMRSAGRFDRYMNRLLFKAPQESRHPGTAA
jgi:hypothetical protein